MGDNWELDFGDADVVRFLRKPLKSKINFADIDQFMVRRSKEGEFGTKEERALLGLSDSEYGEHATVWRARKLKIMG